MLEIEYLMSKSGKPKAVVIPIAVWYKIFPKEDCTVDELSESLEDYCLSKAMDEGQKSPLLNRNDALKYLEE